MYKHCDVSDEHISLHDCRATEISYEGGVLSFGFPGGFWILSGHECNASEKNLCTDSSEVRLYLGSEYDATVYLYDEKFGRTIRRELSISDLMKLINHKKCALEFLYPYKGYNSIIFECCLWTEKRPYHKECELRLYLKKAEYLWNDLLSDREW